MQPCDNCQHSIPELDQPCPACGVAPSRGYPPPSGAPITPDDFTEVGGQPGRASAPSMNLDEFLADDAASEFPSIKQPMFEQPETVEPHRPVSPINNPTRPEPQSKPDLFPAPQTPSVSNQPAPPQHREPTTLSPAHSEFAEIFSQPFDAPSDEPADSPYADGPNSDIPDADGLMLNEPGTVRIPSEFNPLAADTTGTPEPVTHYASAPPDPGERLNPSTQQLLESDGKGVPRSASAPSLVTDDLADSMQVKTSTNRNIAIGAAVAVVGLLGVGLVATQFSSDDLASASSEASDVELPFTDGNAELQARVASAFAVTSSDRCELSLRGPVIAVQRMALASYHDVANDTEPMVSGAISGATQVRSWSTTEDLALFDTRVDEASSLDWASTNNLQSGQHVWSVSVHPTQNEPVLAQATIGEVEWSGGLVSRVTLQEPLTPGAIMLTSEGDVWGWVDQYGLRITTSESIRLTASQLQATKNLAQPTCGVATLLEPDAVIEGEAVIEPDAATTE